MLSVVVPVYNEAANIRTFYKNLKPALQQACKNSYEILYVDDGSRDATATEVARLRKTDDRVKFVSLSRNFGKEMALTAGIAHATGRAMLTIDGDGQHPAEKIPQFVAAWRQGAQVVIGVREQNQGEGLVKKLGSKMFYWLFNRLSGARMIPGSGDFRLMDREVQQAFLRLREPSVITRGLIDWLGFEQVCIPYTANARTAEAPRYTIRRLVRLAAHSFVSLSPTPLYAFGYLGLFITSVSFLLGVVVFVEQLLRGDPLGWNFTGTAMLSILVLFLIGLVLVAQGVMALYVSHIHTQSKGRPLYIVNQRNSAGIVPAEPRG